VTKAQGAWALVFLLSLLGASCARADISACTSGYVKESPDERIRLYTICLKSGNRRGDISWAFGSRGIAYLEKGEIDRAIADFTKAIEYDPKFSLAYYNRATAHLYRGDLDAAEADFSDAVTRQPRRVHAEAHARRGVIRMYKGRCGEALTDFDTALKINRKIAWAYSAKAWLLASCADDQIRNGTEALKLAQKAVSLKDHWKGHDALAAAYAELGQFDDSVREQNVALTMLAAQDEAGPWLPHVAARLALYEKRQPYREQPSESVKAGEWLASTY